jgi:hypothetical protein
MPPQNPNERYMQPIEDITCFLSHEEILTISALGGEAYLSRDNTLHRHHTKTLMQAQIQEQVH